MNVLTYFPYNIKYYLRRPWKFFSRLKNNICNAWQRIKWGWCYADVWDLDQFLLEILPQMLHALAEKGISCPSIPPYDSIEKWHDWLHDLARQLEYARDWEQHNEYAAEYMAQFDKEIIKKHEGQTEIDEKYFAREKELYNEAEQIIANVFTELGKNIFALWD